MPITPNLLFGNLVISRCRFNLVFDPDANLPEYPSISMRGALGWILQELVCPFLGRKKPGCQKCLLNELCPYFILYEQKVKIPGISEAPRPYILYSRKEKGRETELMLTLFGKCRKFLPQIAAAIVSCGKKGIGRGRHCFEVSGLKEITPDGEVNILEAGSGFSTPVGPVTLAQWLNEKHEPMRDIHFVSPARLRKKGKYLSVMDWKFYFESLARRLESLNMLYGDQTRLGKEKWRATCKEFSSWEKPSGHLAWHDLFRYSNRQRKKVPLGGLSGRVSIKNCTQAQSLWWRAASLVHVGKGAVMGMGKIQIQNY